MRSAYKIIVGRHEGKRSVGRLDVDRSLILVPNPTRTGMKLWTGIK
jgi:hypothetical protein